MHDLNALVVQPGLFDRSMDGCFVPDQVKVGNSGLFVQCEPGAVHDRVRAAVAAHDIDHDAHK